MEYKKVGTGWGNGDTFWACSARYGNCTDFHALFISLARAEGIPAKFEIGFPIPEDRTSGVIDGYHCWTEFHLPDVGWFPIDASEAWKHRERRDLYFGTQPADRIQFTIGRDLELGDGHTTGPLNYFIYPHVEVAGKRLDNVKRSFRFSEILDANLPRRSEEHTSELQSQSNIVCRLLLEKKKHIQSALDRGLACGDRAGGTRSVGVCLRAKRCRGYHASLCYQVSLHTPMRLLAQCSRVTR